MILPHITLPRQDPVSLPQPRAHNQNLQNLVSLLQLKPKRVKSLSKRTPMNVVKKGVVPSKKRKAKTVESGPKA